MIEVLKNTFLLFCMVLFAMGAKVTYLGDVDEAYIIKIRYPKCYDVKLYQSRVDNIHNVIYKVKLSFPSKDVMHFYENKLKEIGWIPFIEPAYRDREWHNFIDATVEGCALVHQLLATWSNKEKSKMAVLALRYLSKNMTMTEKNCAKKPNNDIQEVILQVMPYMILPDIQKKK